MSLLEIIQNFYLVVPIIGIIGYLPQLTVLTFTDKPPVDISVSTWFTWTITWFISALYAHVVLGDTLFLLTCSINLIGHCTIIALTLFKRKKYALIVKS